jgi:putative transposase
VIDTYCARARLGAPVAAEIRDTDQGSRFTSEKVLKAHLIKASMDGKWRWLDNVFVERQLTSYFTSHNTRGPQLSPGGVTPDTAYFEKQGDQDRA